MSAFMLSAINSSSKTNEELFRVYREVPNVSIPRQDNAVLDYYNKCGPIPVKDNCDIKKPLQPPKNQSEQVVRRLHK